MSNDCSQLATVVRCARRMPETRAAHETMGGRNPTRCDHAPHPVLRHGLLAPDPIRRTYRGGSTSGWGLFGAAAALPLLVEKVI